MVERLDPVDVIDEASTEKTKLMEYARKSAEWFIDEQGYLFQRQNVLDELSQELDCESVQANKAISELVGDIVDPVQQVTKSDGRYIGIIEFREFPESGCYGYIHIDDSVGKLKRVVCARCVEIEKRDSQVTHATEGHGSIDYDCSWSDLVSAVEYHYQQEHNVNPEEIEVGATLLSGTTISGNTAWHDGNVSGDNGISVGATSVGVTGGALGRVNEVTFNNIEDLSLQQAIGIDNSEGPMFKDSQGTTYPLWNAKRVNAGNNISISGGVGAGSTPVTISASAGSVFGWTEDANSPVSTSRSGGQVDINISGTYDVMLFELDVFMGDNSSYLEMRVNDSPFNSRYVDDAGNFQNFSPWVRIANGDGEDGFGGTFTLTKATDRNGFAAIVGTSEVFGQAGSLNGASKFATQERPPINKVSIRTDNGAGVGGNIAFIGRSTLF